MSTYARSPGAMTPIPDGSIQREGLVRLVEIDTPLKVSEVESLGHAHRACLIRESGEWRLVMYELGKQTRRLSVSIGPQSAVIDGMELSQPYMLFVRASPAASWIALGLDERVGCLDWLESLRLCRKPHGRASVSSIGGQSPRELASVDSRSNANDSSFVGGQYAAQNKARVEISSINTSRFTPPESGGGTAPPTVLASPVGGAEAASGSGQQPPSGAIPPPFSFESLQPPGSNIPNSSPQTGQPLPTPQWGNVQSAMKLNLQAVTSPRVASDCSPLCSARMAGLQGSTPDGPRGSAKKPETPGSSNPTVNGTEKERPMMGAAENAFDGIQSRNVLGKLRENKAVTTASEVTAANIRQEASTPQELPSVTSMSANIDQTGAMSVPRNLAPTSAARLSDIRETPPNFGTAEATASGVVGRISSTGSTSQQYPAAEPAVLQPVEELANARVVDNSVTFGERLSEPSTRIIESNGPSTSREQQLPVDRIDSMSLPSRNVLQKAALAQTAPSLGAYRSQEKNDSRYSSPTSPRVPATSHDLYQRAISPQPRTSDQISPEMIPRDLRDPLASSRSIEVNKVTQDVHCYPDERGVEKFYDRKTAGAAAERLFDALVGSPKHIEKTQNEKQQAELTPSAIIMRLRFLCDNICATEFIAHKSNETTSPSLKK